MTAMAFWILDSITIGQYRDLQCYIAYELGMKWAQQSASPTLPHKVKNAVCANIKHSRYFH